MRSHDSPVPPGLPGGAAAATTYDEIYIESWEAALKKCQTTLEQQDYERALQVQTLGDFRTELDRLKDESSDAAAKLAIGLIYPVLDHYETFAQNFVKLMAEAIDVTMMWGLLSLVFRLALEEQQDSEQTHLASITKWLEKIGHQLRASNEGWLSIKDLTKVKFDATEINRELVVLWLNIIMTYRSQGQERGGLWCLDQTAWEVLVQRFNAAYQTIEEAVGRIERVAEMTARHAQSMIDLAEFQKLLALQEAKQGATLPCNTLPVAQNPRFFGRQSVLQQVEQHLQPANTDKGLTSLALYGLGGIGKTQIALAYAYQRLDDLDAVFWISSEDSLSIQASFSRVAVNGLKLPTARHGAHQENMLLVLDWLQKTSAKWLIIFDNVDRHDVLDSCWPAAKRGAVLVTTRDVLIATLPIDFGLGVEDFGPEEGAKFLLHMAPNRKPSPDESTAALEVATELGGLPLAVNQMAALINARRYSIPEFQTLYKKHRHRLHKERKSGWKYLGYEHSLDTVWHLAFSSLDDDARAVLGVLSFFSADSVPADVFKPSDKTLLPEILGFCGDEFRFDDALEQLTHHAFVRRNIDEDTYRLHRLVQSEYRDRMANKQEEFDAATKLLLDKFPHERGNTYDDEEWLLYERYVPQVLSLARCYEESRRTSEPVQPSMDFVRLLTNAVNAIHDNDTAGVVDGLLSTAEHGFRTCPEREKDRLLWAFLLSLKCMYHLGISDFVNAEKEMKEGLDIRIELLSPRDLLLALSYSWLSMAIASQGRYQEGLDLLLKAGTILEGPAGDVPTRKMVWGFNISRNYYCMANFKDAEIVLNAAVDEADRRNSWYLQVYAHITMASLRSRERRLEDANKHTSIAKRTLETAGTLARFSWISCYCAYRVGYVALLRNEIDEAIDQLEKAVAIGKLTKVPNGILSRCAHAYSNALREASRVEEAEKQRLDARHLRSLVPGGGGDLDDESDEAFEMLVKMDQR